ncbi:hypothetical protein [Alteromonas oceanisediminis]|uniref:hypothetical protein n=1 Tax=Alteromonas oceanisediminis TaxID=2836180 RepID=UPI001BDB51DC|nr:hypothetical protein [Alteromonas oceanisediminis]MBT0588110.1 hypothetical protein [Alteromonas oceanisediminis]
MDFSGKGFEFAALIPYVVLVAELIGLDPVYLTISFTVAVIIFAKFVYQKFIRSAGEDQQLKRYAMFFMLPVLLLFGSLYV